LQRLHRIINSNRKDEQSNAREPRQRLFFWLAFTVAAP